MLGLFFYKNAKCLRFMFLEILISLASPSFACPKQCFRNKTPTRLWTAVLATFVSIIWTVCFYLNYVATNPTPEITECVSLTLHEAGWTFDGNVVPFALAGYIFEAKFALCMAWFSATVVVSYAVIVSCEIAIMKELHAARGSMATATRTVHADVQRALVVQVSASIGFTER